MDLKNNAPVHAHGGTTLGHERTCASPTDLFLILCRFDWSNR